MMSSPKPYPQVQLEIYDQELKPFTDGDGLIGHFDISKGIMDYGDSFQRFGFDAIGRWLFVMSRESSMSGNNRSAMLANIISEYQRKLPLYEAKPDSGIYRRHPRMWFDPVDLSRDQETPNNIFMSWASESSVLIRMARKNMISNRLKRFGWYQNKDYTSPEHWMYLTNNQTFPHTSLVAGIETGILLSLLINPTAIFALLLTPGMFFLIGCLIRVYKSYRDHDDVGDDLNLVCALMHFKTQTYYSPLVLIGEWIYTQLRWRPEKYRRMDLACSGMMYAIDHYFRGPYNPPLHKIWNLTLPYYVKGRHILSIF